MTLKINFLHNPLSKVRDISVILGCDPEFFIRSKGEVIGAEKVLPEKGLKAGAGLASKFVIDGVQAELNPIPSSCRALLAAEIAACFKTLDEELKKKDKGFTVDFSRTIEISKEALMDLEEKSRVFGCAPSNNIYQKVTGLKLDKVDPTEYRTRAAGGHIHLGIVQDTNLDRALTTDHLRTVQMLDLICGNTSVLMDRDPGNIERRKVYGKAGEYRLPKHGLEYRTLSNFWLHSYPLMSCAFGLARLAVQLMGDPKNHEEFYSQFTGSVDMDNVALAINNNDYDLAMENFLRIAPLLKEVTTTTSRYPINGANIELFLHFVDTIKNSGLEYWFKDDPMTHWTKNVAYQSMGFWDFAKTTIKADLNKAKAKTVTKKEVA